MLFLADTSRARYRVIKDREGEIEVKVKKEAELASVRLCCAPGIATSPPDDAGSPASLCGEPWRSAPSTQTPRQHKTPSALCLTQLLHLLHKAPSEVYHQFLSIRQNHMFFCRPRCRRYQQEMRPLALAL